MVYILWISSGRSLIMPCQFLNRRPVREQPCLEIILGGMWMESRFLPNLAF